MDYNFTLILLKLEHFEMKIAVLLYKIEASAKTND